MANSTNLIYGHHPVVEAIRQGERGEIEKEIRHLTKEFGIPLQVVPKEKLNKLVKGTHQGVVAWLSLVTFMTLDEVVPWVFEQGQDPLILILDSITDVRNFGAICRTAEVMGVHAVVIPENGAAPANEEAMKASAGALARIRLCRVRSLFSSVDYLKEAGLHIVATALTDRSIPVYEVDFKGPVAILMGAEGDGLHPKLIKMADTVTKIPQATDFDSLNVGVAAGICLYEAVRQRTGLM
jgi:23S rRNA (guanosine2251-2'-O)-methyltransferase